MFLKISEEEYRACAKLYLKDGSNSFAKSGWVRGDPNTDTKRLAVLLYHTINVNVAEFRKYLQR